MKIRIYKQNKTIKETVFFISYTIYLTVNFLGWSKFNIPSFLSPLTNIIISLLLIMAILSGTKMTLKHLTMAVILVILCLVISMISSNTTGLIVMILFIICAKDIEYQKFINRYFVVGTIMLCLILFLYFIGFLDSLQWVRIEVSGEKIYRYSMGFKYTTFGPLLFMCSIFAYLSIKENEINLIETIVILVVNYFLYYWTNTRAVYYLILCTVVIYWIKRLFPFALNNKFIYIVCVAITPIMAIVSLELPLMDVYNNNWINEIDALLSYRIRLGREAISRYGLSSLFGNNIVWTGAAQGDLVDSSYLRILLEYGWMLLILICFGFVVIQIKNCRSKNYGMAVIISLYMIHSFTDPQLLSIAANPFLLLLGSVFNNNNVSTKEISSIMVHKHE